MNRSDGRSPVARPWRPRFGLGAMFLVMLVFVVMGTAGYYFVRSRDGGHSFQLTFILFTLASPLLLVVVISLLRSLLLWIDQQRQDS